MDLPEELRALVDLLGEALVEALVNDSKSRGLAARIQEQGYDLALAIEATVALTPRDPGGGPGEEQGEPDFSPDDEAFLKKFKIRLD
ncbi:MAG: hypothetical protein HY823_12965 [Acidobacteria bacterium]|nr:hypothetical protein [Acidobacteriota bacterium]